jgi:hypothetical protein
MQEKGCFTQDKFIAGRSLEEIEKILGFAKGRLSAGGVVVALIQLPQKGQFRVGGYTNVSLDRFKMSPDLDPNVLEKNAMQQWELKGRNRLVKVVPTVPHDPSVPSHIQYPHAYGAPQWEVLVPLPCILAGPPLAGYPKGIYQPAY